MNTNIVKKNDKQIVTVAVITYHSAATVLETLDSIVSQTYGPENIELIISDDGSKDNTVEVINEWLTQNRTRFHSAIFFANEVNSGISKNCNVAWKAATSDWIKTIAGDDLLIRDCIVDNVDFINCNQSAKIVFSQLVRFSDDSLLDKCKHISSFEIEKYIFSQVDCREQYKLLIRFGGVSVAPTSFIKLSLLKEIGFADINYPSFEDLPLWVETCERQRVFFLEKNTVMYRLGESITTSRSRVFNFNYLIDLIRYNEYVLKNKKIDFYTKVIVFDRIFYLKSMLFIAMMFSNKKSKPCFYAIKIRSLFSIYKWYLKCFRLVR
ncbi:glycosyltransferase family 2 protein [Shewanella oncorhynchi]|uniref:glycosyltransferase family 2 protein n=1 Tax=Shewanella oncorhynchi TaxID=2726434 RepID=UPI003D79BA9C